MKESAVQGLEAVAGPVSRETFDRLVAFQSLFEKWSSRVNLAAPSTIPNIWDRHILDSAQLFPMAPNALRWLDLGSGGGYPGAILAILLKERSGASIDLVESNKKKASFLRTAIAAADAPGLVHAERVDDYAPGAGPADIVTARALAPLGELFSLARPWLENGAVGLFHKGRDYRSEIEESRDGWQFDLVEHRSAIDAASVVLEISGLKKR